MNVSRAGGVGRVLVIESNPLDRARIETVLSEAGYAVDTAIDLIHAAELAMLQEYGLVLLSTPGSLLSDRLAALPALETDANTDIVAAVAERLGFPERRDPPLIDSDRIARLRNDTADDLFSKVVDHFRHGARERLGRITSLSDGHDLALLGREAHALKGISATFGALRLRACAAAIEKAAKATNLDRVRAVLPELRAVAEETWACFEQELSKSESKHHES